MLTGMLPGSGWSPEAIQRLQESDRRHRFLGDLDDRLRALVDAVEITGAAAQALGQYLDVNRCAYATVEDDEDTFSSSATTRTACRASSAATPSGSSARSACG